MTKQRPRTAQMIALTFLISLAICSNEQTETEYEKSFDELKANIEFYENQNNSFGTGQFTALKITTRGITTHETLEMYQSLFKVPVQDGKITVLTIKNTHIPEAFSLEKCIESIATAAQNHIYGKRNETTSDDLCIRIERVDSAKNAEHSSWNRVLEEVEKTEKDFAVFILENLFSIIHKSFIQYIFESMFVFKLNELIKKLEVCENLNENNVQNWDDDIITGVESFSVKNMCKMVSNKSIVDEYSLLSFLKSFVYDYEKRNGYKYFTQNDKAIEQFFIDTVEKYRYFVDQQFDPIVQLLVKLSKNSKNNLFLETIYGNMHKLMVKYAKKFCIVGKTHIEDENYALLIKKSLKFDPTFTEQHQEYYKMISFDPAHLRISDQDRKTDLLKSLRADNVAKIIIRGELDEAVLSRICNTLRSTELMKNFIGHQSMYIDFEREMTKDQLESSLDILKSEERSLPDAVAITDDRYLAIEVFTTVKSLNNHNKCGTIEFMTYTTDTVAVKEQQGSQILAKCTRIATQTMIHIETLNNQHGSAILSSSKLGDDGNQAGHVDVITINDGCKIVKISITRNAKCDLGKETISITYNIWELNGGGNDYGPKQSVAIVKTLPNLPVLYLKGLAQNVYLQQLTTGIDFVIPNLVTFDGIDYLYTEIIIDEFRLYFLEFIDDQNDRLCKWQNDKKRYAIISRNEILEVADIVDSNTNHELPYFVRSLDMDDARINRIIYEYVKSGRNRQGATKIRKLFFPLEIDDDVCIFGTCEKGSGYTLHICEPVERKNMESLEEISTKLLDVILDDFNYENLMIIIDKNLENRAYIVSLISEIVMSFYKKVILSGMHMRHSEIQAWINMIDKWFAALNKNEKSLFGNNADNQYLKALHHYTCVAHSQKFITDIIDKINRAHNPRKVKVTSINMSSSQVETV